MIKGPAWVSLGEKGLMSATLVYWGIFEKRGYFFCHFQVSSELVINIPKYRVWLSNLFVTEKHNKTSFYILSVIIDCVIILDFRSMQ